MQDTSVSHERRYAVDVLLSGAPARYGERMLPRRASALDLVRRVARSLMHAGRSLAPSRAPYPGDAATARETAYAPKPDGRPDPGEIVWTWVPFEEDHALGKDRPVLLIGREEGWLVGLPLTSKDHDRDAAQERSMGRTWVDIGSGPWDRRDRPSEVRVNRLVRVDPRAVRREGAVLPRARYEEVLAAVRLAGLT